MDVAPVAGAMLGRTFVVVARSRETRRSVHDYLARVGADVVSHRALSSRLGPADGFVFFPDDLSLDSASRTLSTLRRLHPTAPIVVVTAHVARYRREGHVTVLRSPVWGWMILEALRASS